MAVDTFDNRIAKAEKQEVAMSVQLEALGCKPYPFGQALLPDEARNALRKHAVYIRWLGDLLVILPDGHPVLVDVKAADVMNTPNWALEKAAHAAHRLQQDALSLPHIYIWPDGCSCSFVDDLPDEKLKEGPRGGGSGTPYWLVPKKLTRPLDSVFGKKAETPRNVNAHPSKQDEQVGLQRARTRPYHNPRGDA